MEDSQYTRAKSGASPPNTLHEQRTADNSAAYLLPTLQSMKDANPQLKVLDVGCGSGTISVSLAKLIPKGHVTGIDPNTKVLPRARANANAAGVDNIDFIEGSAFKLPFDDETFDVTCCHQVLIHIGQPWDALREMFRVTKKGGVVAAREGDYESEVTWPQLSGLQDFHGLMASLMKAGGGDPTAGRQLRTWALRAGAEPSQVKISYSTSSYSTPNERALCAKGLCDQLRGGGMYEKAKKFGLEFGFDFEEMAKAWEVWAKADDGTLAMLHGEIIIQK